MSSTELERNNYKNYWSFHCSEAIQTSTTVLDGEDTDLVVLLFYHASLDSYDLFFHPEPKKTQIRSNLVNICNNILLISILFFGVTQHYVSMGLESLASSKQAVYI